MYRAKDYTVATEQRQRQQQQQKFNGYFTGNHWDVQERQYRGSDIPTKVGLTEKEIRVIFGLFGLRQLLTTPSLSDTRVNPAVNNNYPLFLACEGGHTKIVQALLKCPTVSPASLTNKAFIVACEKYGHREEIEKRIGGWCA